MTAPANAQPQPRFDPILLGTIFGTVSALGYTGANMGLRAVAVPHDPDWALWVSCLKAFPTAVLATILVARRMWLGLPTFQARGLIASLVAAGVFMQFGGNAMFQWALGVGGLAVVVPLSFAVLIGTGAWLGRVWLGEPITPRSALAMLVLITSIAFLSVGAGDAAAAMTKSPTAWAIAVTVLGACVSGLAYGVGNVVMRRAMTRDVAPVVVLLIMSAMGVLGLGAAALIRLGPDRLLATSPRDFQIMLAAGLSNAVAFYCLASALKYVSVVHANLVNASQIAMSAAAGVLMFSEPLTGWTGLGCGLTVAGLLLMDTRGKRPED